MAVRKQVPVRVEPEVAARWSEVADARGIALNTFIVDAANASADSTALDSFATTKTGANGITTSVSVGGNRVALLPTPHISAAIGPDPLLAFDLAVSQTPALTGLRKWVDPVVLRVEFAKLVKPE